MGKNTAMSGSSTPEIFDVETSGSGFTIRLNGASSAGYLEEESDGTNTVFDNNSPNLNVNDGRWHSLIEVVQRDGNCQRFVDGVAQTSKAVSSVGKILK